MTGLRLRERLFVSVVVLVAAFAGVSGWWLSGRLRQELVADAERHLGAHARTLSRVIPAGADVTSIRRATEDFSDTTGARITVITLDGLVLADSAVTDPQALDNHGARPEVQAAMRDGYGVSIRWSDTVHRNMLYVAVPWPVDRPVGVVRLARSLDEVEARVARVSRVLLATGFVGLLLTMLVAAAFAERFTRDLRELTVRARRLARDPASGPGDEVAWISGSIERLASELSRSVDDVAEQRNRLQAVLAGLDEAVVAVDGQGRVVLTNPAADALLGLDRTSPGRSLIEAVGWPDLDAVVARVLTGQQPEAADLRWSDEGGHLLDLHVTVTPQLGSGAVVVVVDMTELRRLEAVRRDFVANVSHELRTPVAVIQSSAEALQSGAAQDPVHGPRFVEAIDRHARRLANLIEDLLALARIERGAVEVQLVSVPLRAVVNEAIELLAVQAERRRQRLTVQIPDGLAVRADRVALRQIVSSLVENAVKYTPEGGNVTVVVRSAGDPVELAVEDDGPGIPDQHHARIFERFYRVDPGRSRDMGGTGLGLSIARHLADLQGARVRVEHNRPRGARFVVTLARA